VLAVRRDMQPAVGPLERRPDPPIPVYDLYGPGDSHDFDVIT
jgi:hypothetical protein